MVPTVHTAHPHELYSTHLRSTLVYAVQTCPCKCMFGRGVMCVCVCKHTKRAKVGTLSVWRICDGHILMMRSKGTITSSMNNRRASACRSLLVLWCRQGLNVVGQGIRIPFVYPPVFFLPRGLDWLPLCIIKQKKKKTEHKKQTKTLEHFPLFTLCWLCQFEAHIHIRRHGFWTDLIGWLLCCIQGLFLAQNWHYFWGTVLWTWGGIVRGEWNWMMMWFTSSSADSQNRQEGSR